MSGLRYLADTNAFIFLLDKHPALKNLLESDWYFSFITEIELLGKPGISPQEIRNIRNLLDSCVKAAHVEEINKLTISLKQQYKIKLPDALIAATAIFHDLPLLTFDKGFSQIKSVDLILLEQ
jgi:predicted nucleic acid-binding protein